MSRGIPLTPAEAAELDRRQSISWELSPAMYVARTLAGYSEVYIDQYNGGISVFLFTGDIEAHRTAIDEVMPDWIDFEVKTVRYTIKQLRTKQRQITTTDMLEAKWLLSGDMPLSQVGFDVVTNRVLVGLE